MRPILLILLLVLLAVVVAELPTELDPFMEKLFETEECESFISGEFSSVATSDCEPYTCDFPRQFCVRPAAKYTDKSANMCKDIPSDCLTAANGGVPLGPPVTTQPPLILPPLPEPEEKKIKKTRPGGMFPRGRLVTGRPSNLEAICDMDPPSGRFCGFKVMYTYNKETYQCDEFWFPGCRTSETNENLFTTAQDCQRVVDVCKPTPPPTTTTPLPLPTFPTFPPMTLPPPPPPPNPHRPRGGGGGGGGGGHRNGGGWGSMGQGRGAGHGQVGQGGQGGMGGMGGMGQGAGLAGLAGLGGLFGGAGAGGGDGGAPGGGGAGGAGEEDLGLVGLIQKGLVSAQAINKGGKQGKEAAATAAGQFLQTFTGFDINNIGGNFGNFFNGR